MTTTRSDRLCMLMILDGWGIAPAGPGNAVLAARTPNLDRLMAAYPVTRLACHGEAVGLPGGIMGNSEVGHLNIGAGRVVYQDLLRIDRAVQSGDFGRNPVLGKVMAAVLERKSTLHLLGLVSDGGVHSQLTHLLALLDMAQKTGVPRTCVHVVTDGRDTSPSSGAGFVEQVIAHMTTRGYGAVATVCGRYYAMDRDKRWDRTESAFRLYTQGEGRIETDAAAAVRAAYDRDETDEFIRPVILADAQAKPVGVFQDGDGLIFFNFRADRMRQIVRSLTDPAFGEFSTAGRPAFGGLATMTLYDEQFDLPIAFPPEHLENILGEVMSRAGRKQLRIAETEKYAHVTYFFNGGEETAFPGEERCLIPSPRDVATYDLKPEMSAPAVTEEALRRISTGDHDFIVLNFANMDMVGHTGDFDAAVRACETVDACVGPIIDAVLGRGGAALVTADHGNAEQMRGDGGGAHTAHTLNPVPLVLVDDTRKSAGLRSGRLADIAPTALEIMALSQPVEMTGRSLIDGSMNNVAKEV